MAPANLKPNDIPAPTRRSARLSNKRTKMTTEKCDAEIEIKQQKGLHQVAPAKRKATATSAPTAPTRSSVRLSNKRTKMTNAKLDAEIEITHEKEAARTWAPKVQVPHDCKKRLDELTRLLDCKTLGSTLDFLLPTIEGAQEIAELSRDLGHDTGGKTIDWLLQQAEPAIAARVGRQDASTVMTGYSAAPPMHAPPLGTPQFSQNQQGVTSFTFTSTGGLGTGSTAWYSSNLYPPAFKPTTMRSSTGPVTTHRSEVPFPSTYFNGFSGGTVDQSQIEGYTQFQGRSMYNPIPTNMQGFPPQQSQISTCLGKSQQETAENVQFHKRVGRNIVGLAAGVGLSTPITPVPHSVKRDPNHNPATVHYGDTENRMDQVQAPHTNHIISQVGAPSLHKFGGAFIEQNHDDGTPTSGASGPNTANHMSSGTPNPNTANHMS